MQYTHALRLLQYFTELIHTNNVKLIFCGYRSRKNDSIPHCVGGLKLLNSTISLINFVWFIVHVKHTLPRIERKRQLDTMKSEMATIVFLSILGLVTPCAATSNSTNNTSTSVPPTTTTETIPISCPDGWIYGPGNNCYFMDVTVSTKSRLLLRSRSYNAFTCTHLKNSTMTWTDAVTVCSDHPGAYLAEIRSQEEHNFVSSQAEYLYVEGIYNGSWWLGAFDFGHEGRWEWIFTGDNVQKFWWDEGQPDNRHEGENCLELKKGNVTYLWNDAPCESDSFAVCQFSG